MSKKNHLLLTVFALCACLLFFADTSLAAVTKTPTATTTDEVTSSDNLKDEYFKVRTPLDEKGVIYVEGKVRTDTKRLCIRLKAATTAKWYITAFVTPDSSGAFSIKIDTSKGCTNVPEVLNNLGTVTQVEESWGTQPGYKPVDTIPAGIYALTIARATTDEDADVSRGAKWSDGSLSGNCGYCFNAALLTVASGDENNPKLVKYQSVMENNSQVQNQYESSSQYIGSYTGSYVRYLDKYMDDLSYYFTDPKTGVSTPMTASRITYLKTVADRVTAGATDNYEKLLRIYEYAADNFYYDNYAFSQKKYQYANPYLNIYNLEEKKTSANSAEGKVGVTCQGYANIVIALARVEGIPARLVEGHHLSFGQHWGELPGSKIATSDHFWAEAYVDGRWIVIDANSGSGNKWNRTGFSDSGAWNYRGITNYTGFDPSVEIFANYYSCNAINRGSSAGQFACYLNEINQLKTFLNKTSGGKTNGKRLNKNYSANNCATWTTGNESSFLTNGFGRVSHISWGDKNMAGTLDLSNFKSLKYLTLYNNDITGLKLTGCSELLYLSANYNQLTTFHSTGAPKLETILVRGDNLNNKLTSAVFKHNGKNITIKSSNKNCFFSFEYQKANKKSLTIYAGKAPKGYTYLGIYNAAGKRLSSKTTYTFNPGNAAATYYVKYRKN